MSTRPSIRPRRLAARAVSVLAAPGTVVRVTTAPASTHVTARPGQAGATGSGTAGPVALRVTLPAPTVGPVPARATAADTARLTGGGLLVGAPGPGPGGGAVRQHRRRATETTR